MKFSGRTFSGSRSVANYIYYLPVLFASIMVALAAMAYLRQHNDHITRDEIQVSRYAVNVLRGNLERTFERDIYTVNQFAKMIENAGLTGTTADAGHSLFELAPGFGVVGIVEDGNIVASHTGESGSIIPTGVNYQDWKTQIGLRMEESGTENTNLGMHTIVLGNQRFIAIEVQLDRKGTNIIALISVDDILFQSGVFDTVNHTLLIREMRSNEIVFGVPGIDMSNGISEMLVVGASRWIIHAKHTGPRIYLGPAQRHVFLSLILISFLLLAPVALACHLLMLKNRSQGFGREREQKLRDVSTRLGMALTESQIGITEIEPISGDVIWDSRSADLFGVGPDDQAKNVKTWWKNIHFKDRAQALQDFKSIRDGTTRIQSEYRVRLADGTERNIRSTWSAINTGPEKRLLGAHYDVTADNKKTEALIHAHRVAVKRNKELLRAKDQVEYLALHDPLTGLANRRYFDDYIANQSGPSPSGERIIGVLQVDLDSFKQVNDSFGHAAGDKVLSHAARALDRCTLDNDFIARLGGDEFVICCRRSEMSDDVVHETLDALAQKLISAVQQPMILNGKIYKPAVSIGIAPVVDTETSWATHLANADAALYQAKNIGRNRHAFHTGNAEVATSFGIIRRTEDIFSGIENQQFLPVYQPQFSAHDRTFIGIETLARWHHPTRGILMPDTFMPAAKYLKLEAEIDAHILDRALADIAHWRDLGLDVPRVAVNISPRRLSDTDLIAGLSKMDIPAGSLSFELLESIFFGEDDDQLLRNVDQIKALGIDVEIDDFGTGFASIVSLIRLEPHRLKIDRSLVAPVMKGAAPRQVVRSIVEMARALNIEVLAEGVETELQARMLRTLGCDSLQGYGLAKPMDTGKMTAYLTRQKSTQQG